MDANEIEIICLCGDHITLTRFENKELFTGHCIGCNRKWLLKSEDV
ncbi:unnamed protein product [marine sediment metagenome]|uniref:Uncharacterized protein n=1 Tax=marine sediment metagenome TaxID=412755 RepID=X1Q7R8_9ZZZZ